MKSLTIFFAIIVGVLLFLVIFCWLLWHKIRRRLNNMGIDNASFKNIMSSITELKQEDSERIRSVSGMTKLLLPSIIKDFPSFNENQLYNMTEESLRIIFSSITNNDKSQLKKVPLLSGSIIDVINNNKNNHIDERYLDVKFHNFAIKDYVKHNGVATIIVSTSLEYFHKKIKDGIMEVDDQYKEQTRLACTFIYVYDESLFKQYEKVLVTNCPNCGAVIRHLGHKYCEYCKAELQEINLKAWAFSSYREY